MVRMRSPVRIWLSAPRDHLCKQLCRGDFLFGTARGGRMTEGNRKQKRSRARQASPSGISACFPENPTGRLLRNHSRFHGAVSADRAGLFRADGPAFALGRRQDARYTDRFRQKVEADSGHWEKRLCHLQTHAIDLYYAHGKEWARLHPMPDRPGKTIPCRR